jgi:hypothetical protein
MTLIMMTFSVLTNDTKNNDDKHNDTQLDGIEHNDNKQKGTHYKTIIIMTIPDKMTPNIATLRIKTVSIVPNESGRYSIHIMTLNVTTLSKRTLSIIAISI